MRVRRRINGVPHAFAALDRHKKTDDERKQSAKLSDALGIDPSAINEMPDTDSDEAFIEGLQTILERNGLGLPNPKLTQRALHIGIKAARRAIAEIDAEMSGDSNTQEPAPSSENGRR
jgi:hypothetical protein